MATLSFSCPKCDQQHHRIKPEMIGHKVKCQCGFVFRIGAKASKKSGVVDELNRKKAIKKRKSAAQLSQQASAKAPSTPSLAARKKSDDIVDAVPVGEDSEPENFSARPMEAIAVPIEEIEPIEDWVPTAHPQPEGAILDAIPVEPEPVEHVQADPLMQIPAELLSPQPPVAPVGPYLPKGSSLAISPLKIPPRHQLRARQNLHLDSLGGTIWTLILSIIGLPVLAWVIWRFADYTSDAYELMRLYRIAGSGLESSGSGMTFSFVVMFLICLMFVALAISFTLSAVVSIIEISKGTRISWATKTSGIIGGVVLVALLLTCGWQVINLLRLASAMNALENQTGRPLDTSNVGLTAAKLIGWYCVYAIIPAAAVITGFCRSPKS